MNDQNNKSLQKIEEHLKHILAIQLYQSGVGQQAIAKHLKISTGKTNQLLKGVEKGKKTNVNPKPQNS